MSTTSHSNTLLPTSPQLIPGMSVSVCIDLNSFASRRAALDGPAGKSVFRGEAMVCAVRSVIGGTDGVVGWWTHDQRIWALVVDSRGKLYVTEGGHDL
jgi:hypothetical protein